MISQQYTRSFELDDRTLNLTIELKGKKVTFKLNFHFEIHDLVQFKTELSEISVLKLKQKATEFISEIYSLELIGETE